MKKLLTLISIIAISLVLTAGAYAGTTINLKNDTSHDLYVYVDNIPASTKIVHPARGYEAGGEVVANSSQFLNIRNSEDVLVTVIERFSKKRSEYYVASAGADLNLIWDGSTIK